jgi:superfamily II DNA or RNA helicase
MAVELQVLIDSHIRLPLRELSPECLDDLKAAFTHDNPKRAALQRMGIPGWRREPGFVRTWAAGPRELTLPRGGMGRVRAVLEGHGVEWEEVDRRCEGDAGLGEIPAHRRQLRAHQMEGLAAVLARQQGILRAPTGSGKTTLGFAAASAARLPTLVVVDSQKLLDQWLERAWEELGLPEREVGVIQGKTRRLRALTLGMGQTLCKCAGEFADVFGVVIVDEVQTAAAPTFLAAVSPFAAKYRIGISADERRKDGKEFLIHDVFGDVIHETSRDELEDAGHILDVEVRVVPTDFRADWYGMPADAGDEREVDFGRLLEEMAADEGRNALAVEVAMGEVHAGQPVLVMAHRREHCQVLSRELVARRARSGFLIGGSDYASEFDRTKRGLLSGEMDAGVGTLKAIGKGIDMPAVGRAVVVTPIFGNKQFSGQVRGRICRAPEGKRDAVQYVLWDQHCSFALQHLKNMLAWNRTVRVLDGGRWVDGRAYLKALRDRAA